MYHKKHFSIEEANSLLPLIDEKLNKIIFLKKSLDEQNYDIYKHSYFGGITQNGSGIYPKEFTELITNLNELTAMGIQIKSLDNGLIDFPHIRENGEEVYLCYIYGEESIKFWHSIKDGFAGRKPIEDR